jgi:hypothetical protein
MKLSNLPPDFVKLYNLKNLANDDGTIYVKYIRACTVSHKWASLHKISIKNDSPNTATNKARSHWVFGNMTGGLSHSLSVLTTLASSIPGRSTPNILQKFSTNTRNVPLTGRESATLA